MNEEIVILGSKYMLSLLDNSEFIFIDGTFKTAAKGYYQLLVVMILDEQTNMFVPIIYGLLTSKTQDIYEYFFFLLQLICSKNEVLIKAKKAVMDLEEGLHNGWKKVFPQIQIIPCFFHYVKFFFINIFHIS